MKIKWILLTVLLMTVFCSHAQDSLQVRPSPELPQGQPDNPVMDQRDQKEDRVAIQMDEIPSILKDNLTRTDKFAGWEEGKVYYEKNSDQYLLHIVDESNNTRTFRFDKKGNEVLTSNEINDEESKQ